MKLLYAHDHKFYRYKNNYYSNGNFSKEVLLRYTKVFEEVKFVSRQIKVNEKPDKMTLANTENVEFVKIPDFKSLRKYYKIKEAKRIIQNEVLCADCVIARLPSYIGTIAIKYAEKYNIPYLIEVVGCAWDALWYHSLLTKFMAPFRYFQMKNLVKNSKYVVYVTNKFLQKRYPTKGESVNCSNVALEEFDVNVLLKRLNKIDNMKKNEKIILGTTAAVDVRYKSQQYVIKALGKLKKQGIENYEYQLVGGGDQTYLKSIAKKYNVSEQVKFIGVMPHNKVYEWLDNIDIYLQPSRVEGLPRALIEAMSRGLPAIGSKAGGIPELLESQFIFSIGRKAPDKICSILQGFNKNIMREQAKRNYFESKKYDKENIEMRRKEFFNKFKSNVNCKVNLG